MSRAPRGLANLKEKYDEQLRIRERPRRGNLVIWCKPGRIIKPTPACRHTFEAIIQPGDYERIMNCWLAHCGKCHAMITGEAVRANVVKLPTKPE